MTQPAEITPEELHAYFDGELEGEAHARVEALMASDAGLKARVEDLSFMGAMVAQSLEDAAQEISQARFEQVRDQIDREIDREARLQQAAENEPGLWARVVGMLGGARGPLLAVAAAAVVLVIVAPWEGGPGGTENRAAPLASNTPGNGDAVAPSAPEQPPMQPVPDQADPAPSQIAQGTPAPDPAQDTPFPAPESNDADIQRIEFGGRTGRVSQIEGTRGTTTVIWVSEEEPSESERPL